MNTKLALIPVLMLVGCSSMTKTIHERCMEVTKLPDGLTEDSTEEEVLAHYKVKTVDEAIEKASKDFRFEFQRHGSLERCYAQKLADDQSWADLVANAGTSLRNASNLSPEAEAAYQANRPKIWAETAAPQPQTVILRVEPSRKPPQYTPFK